VINPLNSSLYVDIDFGRSRDRDQAGLACWPPGTCASTSDQDRAHFRPQQLKIEIPANRHATRYICVLWLLTVLFRYDLLCIEGIARALRAFLSKEKAPGYRLVYPPGGEKDLVEVSVAPEVSQVHALLSVL
jgi:hypothetical protein